MFKSLSIRKKLIALLLAIGLVPLTIIGLVANAKFKEGMKDIAIKQLISIRESKKAQIEHYFAMINDQIIDHSKDRMIIDAVEKFTEAFWKVEKELLAKYESTGMENEGVLKERYKYQKENTYKPPPDSIAKWWPEKKVTQILQHLYISSNPRTIGRKHELDYALDSSTYSEVHKKYHPIIRNFRERIIGYYDIFLIEPETGHIVYSVFKELDFATSLLSGPYKHSNLAKVVKAAIDTNNADFVSLLDFDYYEPSYNQPAAFIASPIYNGEKKVGILAFQIPIDQIDKIMVSHRKWKDVGLGSSAETYLVGEDFTMRNDSRFLIETPGKYFKQIELLGYPEEMINKIKTLKTTILLQKVKTPGSVDALKGNTGFGIFPDYRKIRVLSSYTPVDIKGVNWVLMSEIDEDEAFMVANTLRNLILTVAVFIAILVFITGVAAARSFLSPIEILSETAVEIGKGNLSKQISVKSKDEFGQLAFSFNKMAEDLRKTREETVSAKEYTENIIRSLIGALIVITPEAKIKMVNIATCILSGYREEELLGKPVSLLFAAAEEEISPLKGIGLDELIKKDFVSNIEKNLIAKDGRKIPVLFSGSVMHDDTGKIQGMVCVALDITEKKMMDKQLLQVEKLSSIGTFVSGVAHELNNPLAAILGYSEHLLEDKNLSKEIRDDLKQIMTQSERSARIVKNLLRFSREQKEDKSVLNVVDILESAINLEKYHFRSRNILIKKDFASNLPSVTADSIKIQQVFINILFNAYQAMTEANIEGEIRVKTEKKENKVEITIENDGPLIPEDKLYKIFDPFFTTKEVGVGTGLGLSVSYEIIKEHGGSMRVENVGDSGVRFTISLPATRKKTKEVKEEKAELKLPENIKVLVADDEESIRGWLQKLLTKKGARVFLAANGKEAIEILEKDEVDVIISDARMPECSGFELVEWLKNNKPAYLSKFILLTGAIDQDISSFCEQNQCSHLLKPLQGRVIIEKINSLL